MSTITAPASGRTPAPTSGSGPSVGSAPRTRHSSAHPAFNVREYTSSIIVTSLSALFGAALMGASDALVRAITGSGADELPAVRTMLTFIAWVFLGIALFVGAIVTVNTVGTIIAGRAKRLALLRLLGASAGSLRRATLREGLTVGVLGSVIGTIVGSALVQGTLAAAHAWWQLPEYVYAGWFTTDMIAPALAAVAVTTVAGWIGSRRILTITPIQAFGTARAATESENGQRRRFPVIALILGVIGAGILAAGATIGWYDPTGVLVAMPGGIIASIGFLLAADRIIPVLLSIGGSWGASGAARLAARNAVRNPKRSSRATVGLIIGVALITMFAVVGFTYRDIVIAYFAQISDTGIPADQLQQAVDALLLPVSVVIGLVGFSVLISVVGLINSLTLSTIQRRTELGLLRALGLDRSQIRAMTFYESLRMTIVAVVTGLFLGVIFGWIGTISLLGAEMKLVGQWWPSLSWQLVAGVAVIALAVSFIATLVASRRAVTVSPVEALAQD